MSIRICETPKERKRSARENASAVLHMGDNRLSLVLASLASIMVSFVSYFIARAMALMLSTIEVYPVVAWLVMNLLAVLFFLLFAAPLWLGTYRMALRMVDGYGAKTEDILHFVRSRELYARALGISFELLARWIPALIGFLVMQLFFDFDLVGLLLVVFFAITVLLSLLFVSKLGGFVTAAVIDDHRPLERARWLAATIVRNERMQVFGFHIGMTWRMLVSLLPVGIVFLLHTLPMSMLCAACYVKRMAVRDDVHEDL